MTVRELEELLSNIKDKDKRLLIYVDDSDTVDLKITESRYWNRETRKFEDSYILSDMESEFE